MTVGPLRDKGSLEDGGAELREYAAAKGYELELVESTPTSCTVRAARDPVDYRPLEVTITSEDVKRADHEQHALYVADPAKFLAGWATREAAGDVLPDVVMQRDHERQLEPLGIKPPPLNATADESRAHFRELTTSLEAYRRRETWRRALRITSTVAAVVARPLTRARGPRARFGTARRSPARSSGPRLPDADLAEPEAAAA